VPQAQRVVPTNGLVLTQDTVLSPGTYVLPDGVRIAADGITIEGDGVTLVGVGKSGAGIRMEGCRGVNLRGITLKGYRHGIYAVDCEDLTLMRNCVSDTHEEAPNTLFLDIWLPAERAYGGGILLHRVSQSRIEENDLRHQQSGLLTYGCSHLTVRRNMAAYNSGFGIHLYGTCDSLFEENCADYCCRFEPREGGLHFGHMGADAAGFLAVMGSCRNRFVRNTARLGGDGFFLAGLSPDGTPCGCDENLFEENDGSLSPNIAFEATFCRGNVFRNNHADRSNYGFWLGYSWETTLEQNRMVMNRQAGIAVENGHGFRVQGNSFQANGHGILLWSRWEEPFAALYPESLTSHDWIIERNTFLRNGVAIRIAADQDHGIRALPAEKSGRNECRPRDHQILANDIQDNRLGVWLHRTDRTVLERNILRGNVEANLRQEDCEETVFRNNLGAAGGYL